MLEIYAVRLPESTKEQVFFELLSRVSIDKQARAMRYIDRRDAYRVLLGEILARRLIAGALSISDKQIQFCTTEHGKPYLKGYSDVHFNISHSGDWVVCALCYAPVGIDIERVQPIDEGTVEKILTDEEYSRYMACCEHEKLSHFYDLWTLKESYIKAIGKGFSVSPSSFSIKIHENSIFLEGGNKLDQNCNFHRYNVDGNYKLAVCAFYNGVPTKVSVLDFKDLVFGS